MWLTHGGQPGVGWRGPDAQETRALSGAQWGGPTPAPLVPAHFQQCSRELWGWVFSFWGQSSLVKARRKL